MGSLATVLIIALLGQLVIPAGRTDTQEDILSHKYMKDKIVRESRKFDESWLM